MADKEKVLGFEFQIEGISNEAQELAKITLQLQAIKKERSDLIKQATAPGHFTSNEERQRLAAYNKEIAIQEAQLKTLKRVVDSASDSLARKKALLIELTAKSDKATQAIRDGMAPAIKKLNDEIKAGENARGVFSRNVGNYPDLTKVASGGFRELAGAVGGVHGQIGNVIADFTEASGPAGILTVAIGALAMAWKRTQENVKLYLESADKLKFGFAGFDKDTEAARKDAAKRARGQIAAGISGMSDANKVLFFEGFSDEEKKQAQLMHDQAKLMKEEGEFLLDQVTGVKQKVKWSLEYNKLLQEQEAISDERLVKETEWQGLEVQLVKQRAIVSDQESTTLQKKNAAVEADKIANQLIKSKGDFIDRELNNLNAIAKQTATEEVLEDRINGLLKEKNTIQKEYYADQVKINRLEKTADKNTDAKKAAADSRKLADDMYDEEVKRIEDEAKAYEVTQDQETKKLKEAKKEQQEISDDYYKNEVARLDDEAAAYQAMLDQEVEATKKAEEEKKALKQDVAQAAGEVINTIVDAFDNMRSQAAAARMDQELKGLEENEKEKAKVRLKYIKQDGIWAATKLAIAGGVQTAIIGMTAKDWKQFLIQAIPVGVFTELSIAAIHKSVNDYETMVTRMASGGRVGITRPGVRLHGDNSRDNTLIYAMHGETILNDKQVAMLGGSGMMKRIGVPGYADGGFVGNALPSIPSIGFDIDRLAGLINNLQVVLDVNKLNDAQSGLQVINQTQPI